MVTPTSKAILHIIYLYNNTSDILIFEISSFLHDPLNNCQCTIERNLLPTMTEQSTVQLPFVIFDMINVLYIADMINVLYIARYQARYQITVSTNYTTIGM